jgi:integrase
MPAHHSLEAYLDAYIEAAGIRDAGKVPLFRSAAGHTGMLTEKPMNRIDAWRMIQRRAAQLGLRVKIGCHTFRATGISLHRSRWHAGKRSGDGGALSPDQRPDGKGAALSRL